MYCKLPRLRRRSSIRRLHVSIINTCCSQMNGPFNTGRIPAPAFISYLSTNNSSSSLLTAQSCWMSSSWPLLKHQAEKAGWQSAAPPSLLLINLLTQPMFSCRHRLGRSSKPLKLHLLTCLNLVRRPSNFAIQCHLLLPFSLVASGQLLCAQRRLCSSSR